MKKIVTLVLNPEAAADTTQWVKHLSGKTKIPESDIHHFELLKRSIDARKGRVNIHLKIQIHGKEPDVPESSCLPDYRDISSREEVLIIGSGPAGLFAALRLMELGKKPVILERGKNVKERIKDIKALNVKHIVHEDSNYCFGEGGAGTYSDGKLYTRAKKRRDVTRLLRLLVGFGASPDILVDAHPHIGTNKLPAIITNIRQCLLANGAEIHFNKRVTGFLLKGDRITGVKTNTGETFAGKNIVLAAGHSARDLFHQLHQQGVEMALKPLAMGIRIEHPQALIDQIQYSCKARSPFLPPASYHLTHQADGRGVYTFCMCPGGVIAPCATRPGEIVTNGWSSSRRGHSKANSGIVVSVGLKDVASFASRGPLAAMAFQQSIEEMACKLGGSTQTAPAQRMVDFVNGVTSVSLPQTSYPPGVQSVDLRELLPAFIHDSLCSAFQAFGKKMRGYYTNEAIVVAPETRTSSPVRILRHSSTYEHIRIRGLYPCGEGAGYAGGIVSAALDGEQIAQSIGENRGAS